jgi:hypothetical protein
MFNKIESLNVDNNEKPILVFSDSRVIDNQLNVIEHSFFSYYDINPKKHRLDDLFIRNVCQGCVTILIRNLYLLLKRIALIIGICMINVVYYDRKFIWYRRFYR